MIPCLDCGQKLLAPIISARSHLDDEIAQVQASISYQEAEVDQWRKRCEVLQKCESEEKNLRTEIERMQREKSRLEHMAGLIRKYEDGTISTADLEKKHPHQ